MVKDDQRSAVRPGVASRRVARLLFAIEITRIGRSWSHGGFTSMLVVEAVGK